MSEKRKAERVRANLDILWEGVLAKDKGTISDLSATGCFILTGGEVKDNELISIEINLPSVLRMELWGNVVYHAADIGFALRFRELSATEQILMTRLIEHVRLS